MKYNFLKCFFTDSEYDPDMAKITGFALVIVSVVGFFLKIDGWQWLIGFGAGLIGWKSKVENV